MKNIQKLIADRLLHKNCNVSGTTLQAILEDLNYRIEALERAEKERKAGYPGYD